jgi:hypothetical protein
MKMNKATSVEDFKLVSSFESLRKTLLQDRYRDRMEKPLAYWALPSDRRLPLAFLGRTIGDLLATPFGDLTATQGIGQKKISSLMKLLARATKDEPPAVPFGITELSEESRPAAMENSPDRANFDPMLVSEALWVQWRETVRRAGVGHEKLGRLAPALQDLPTVIWHTPMSYYIDHTVDEIRSMKTHGEKRVRVVLEVFCVVHNMLVDVGNQDHLAVRLVPQFVVPLENWVRDAMDRQTPPSFEEVRDRLTLPLLDQMTNDSGETIVNLARGRLGIDGPPQSVRTQSRKMGVTRARVYQLLDDCSKVMNVRWPEGQMLLRQLGEVIRREGASAEMLRLFDATVELFYPRKYEEGQLEEGELVGAAIGDGHDDDED